MFAQKIGQVKILSTGLNTSAHITDYFKMASSQAKQRKMDLSFDPSSAQGYLLTQF